ncbi:MAG: NAD(P)H-dependent oxidoreductase subunit E [Rhodocyclaceae bacterium]|nr:NAD(P)H-dependent oxidoreductase subunit E [Rhodocyclaceae bacterium]
MTEKDIIDTILTKHGREGTRLLQILREVQEALGWLSPPAITAIARGIGWPRAKVEATAAFYSFFHLRPRGKYCLLWSDNIIDRMQGSRELMHRLCEKLWLEPGRLSEDGLVFVHTTSDIGMGDQGPALLINYRVATAMTPERVDAMAELIRAQTPLAEWPAEWFAVADNVRKAGPLLSSFTPGSALRAALARGAEAQLAEIGASRLRGRGGAGFPTQRKWQACREAPLKEGQTRIVICNADEGEPGTFKDRLLLTRYADLVFEGMTIAAYVLGARKGFLYLRGEYRYLLEALDAKLDERRRAGLLGHAILGVADFDFDIEIHLGAGAYVCGEESALIESLEGKPGRPRVRPPFPVTHGYLEQPTIVNNVETFACVTRIAEHGAEWFARLGTPQSTGTKLFSVSGDVVRPGIYEYPFGTTVAEVLEAAGVAQCVQGVQVSGASGTTLTGDELSRRLCFEDVPTAGALMVFDCRRDMFEAARNFAHFFAHESCGFCTPCRVGTQVVARLMDKLAAGHGSQYDIQELSKLSRLMKNASHCGLGQTACNPIVDTLAKFRPAYERRLMTLDFVPAFDLDAELSQARQMTRRDDEAAHLFTAQG